MVAAAAASATDSPSHLLSVKNTKGNTHWRQRRRRRSKRIEPIASILCVCGIVSKESRCLRCLCCCCSRGLPLYASKKEGKREWQSVWLPARRHYRLIICTNAAAANECSAPKNGRPFSSTGLTVHHFHTLNTRHHHHRHQN